MDDEYIDRVLAGETEAFRYFITTYKDMAFNIALSIVKDSAHAEDVVQESFINAFNGLKSFKRNSKFSSWFYRVVTNNSFTKLKKINRHIEIEKIEKNSDIDSSSPEELQISIRDAMRLLSANESLALNLHYLEGLSLKEIAEITNWSLSNSKVILHRARKRFRQIIENDNE